MDLLKNNLNIQFVKFDELYLESSTNWLSDPELRALTLSPEFTPEDQRIWFEGLACRTDYCIWGISADGRPIGAVGLKHICNDQAEYWGYIGEKSFWGQGIGNMMVHFATEQARRLGIQHLRLQVGAENSRAVRLYLKQGFIQTSNTGAEHEMMLRLD